MRRVLQFLAFSIPVGAYACGIDWKVPTNHFDGVNEWGQLSYWRQIGELDSGGNLKFPIIVGFSPARGGSSVLGKGWIVPLFESNIVQIDEKKFLLTQPDGIVRRFWRKTPTDTVLSGQGRWKGEIKDKSITLWADCGWKLVFNQGKIASITTPENRTFTIVSSEGQVKEIQERGKTLLTISSTPDLVEFRQNGKAISIDTSTAPAVEIVQGQKVIGGQNRAPKAISLQDGTKVTYNFNVSSDLNPALAINDRGSERTFSWQPATGVVLADGTWRYNVQPGDNLYDNNKIERVNAQGQSEFWYYDHKKDVEVIRKLTGETFQRKWFVSGPLAGQLREIEKIQGNKTSTVLKKTYDEKGIPLRVIHNDVTTTFTNGMPTNVSKNQASYYDISYTN